MSKAGGIIGLIAGIFGFIAAVSTLFFGGLGAALEAEGANSVIGLGWGGIFFSFLVIICAAVVFSRPKGAGIALITSSILGAVLGGTLVACCMALSLVGGILAVLGARKTVPVPAHVNNAGAFESLETAQRVSDSSDVLPQSAPPIKKKRIWIWAVLAAFIGIICIIFFAGKDHTVKPKEDPLTTLMNAQPTHLQPYGELAKIFNIGSDYTDLQRENKLKEIKGKVVNWSLPVYEVSRSGNRYKIQTESGLNLLNSSPVGTFVYITPRDATEKQIIEALKTGDSIHFKGEIADTSFRSLVIKPAILFRLGAEQTKPVSLQQSSQVGSAPAQAESQTPPAVSQSTQPERSAVNIDIAGEWERVNVSEELGAGIEITEKMEKSFEFNFFGMWRMNSGSISGTATFISSVKATFTPTESYCSDNRKGIAYFEFINDVMTVSTENEMCFGFGMNVFMDGEYAKKTSSKTTRQELPFQNQIHPNKGTPSPIQVKSDFKMLQNSAEDGNSNAQFDLAMMYYTGDNVDKDDIKAVYWFEKSAEQGNADAQFTLAGLHYLGNRLVKDENKAVQWLKNAAAQGHRAAQEKIKEINAQNALLRPGSQSDSSIEQSAAEQRLRAGLRASEQAIEDMQNKLTQHSEKSQATSPPSMFISPSFDCTKATTPVELAICADPQLGRYDRAMAATYTQARSMGDRQAITEEQRQWVQLRDKQCTAASNITQCLQQQYLSRLQQLSIYMQKMAITR